MCAISFGRHNLGPLYTWGQIEGRTELSKFEPIEWLNFSKSGPKALYYGWIETTTHPMCRLRWRSFGSKPFGPEEAIGLRFWPARFPI